MTKANSSEAVNLLQNRKKMMRIMAEVSFNPAAIRPSSQEELALFMVNHLRSLSKG